VILKVAAVGVEPQSLLAAGEAITPPAEKL